MRFNNKVGTHMNLFILYRNETILLFWIHLPEEVWHVVMAKKGLSLYYVRVFWGFFEPPTHLRKDIFTT
jgi:hypothetical protein